MNDKVLSIVKEVVDSFDPCNLLNIGAPADEYMPEVKHIHEFIIKKGTAQLTEAIIDVFNFMFSERLSDDVAKAMANAIHERLRTI